MNYRHIYHAGNFTEVVKHSILALIIAYLKQKSSAFCYIDTHAGEGLYDLNSEQARKTGEHHAGVMRLMQNDLQHPPQLHDYLQTLSHFKTGDQLTHYPGSPWLAYDLMRPQDRMILNEYHPEVCRQLKQYFYGKEQIAIHRRDAYEFLPAILPPPILRGVALIDPPFEKLEENDRIKMALEKALKRWPQGVYVVWYPITVERNWNIEAVALLPEINQYLIAELNIQSQGPQAKGLIGCRVLVINPPWTLADNLKQLLPHLWKIFSPQGQGNYRVTAGNAHGNRIDTH